MEIIPSAALPDIRPQELKDKDYRSTELPVAAVATFQNPKITEITGAVVYDQWYVGSCVPHGEYTMLEYEKIVPSSGMSQLMAYRKRVNYPAAGSYGVDMLDKIRAGQSPQIDFPTPVGFREEQATAMPLVEGTELIKKFNYFQHLDSDGRQDFSLVAPDVASGKAVAFFFYATQEEWEKEYVEVITPDLSIGDAYVRHCACIIPKGDFTENDKQWFAVHDSAKFGGRHLRYMSLDFFLKRAFFSVKAYEKGQVPPPPPTPPLGKPDKPCQLNQSGDAVKRLQKFLIDQGKLEPQYLTGFYGALTAKAVQWWQLEHWEKFTGGVPKLLEYAGKYWGKESIAIIP